MSEGWTWVTDSTKWHYFVNDESLCGKWMLFIANHGSLHEDKHGSPNHCKTCRKLLDQRKAAAAKQEATR